jgi:His/Glu/Gln/Arg/opine family amino acid ABC transporter permease subunit
MAVSTNTGVVEAGMGPPDIRGRSAPLPRAVFWAGVASLCLVFGGMFAVQIYYAVAGGAVTNACVALGITNDLTGARGVCNIVEAFGDPAMALVLWSGIAVAAAAIVVGFSIYRKMDTRRKREHAATGAIIGIEAVLLGAFLLYFRGGRVDRFALQFLNFKLLDGYVGGFVRGAKNTLLLAFGGEIGGIVIGLLLSIMALSSRRAVRAPARGYINFFRGTPLIWQLSFFWSGIVLGLGLPLKDSAFTAAIIVFALNTGAYAAEVFRAGIQSIERGQMEAARSLGMSYPQAMRYAIVPQAIRRVIPPLMNEFVILIKDTSLVIVLGLTFQQLDLYNFAREGYSTTFNSTFFVGAAIGYLVVTLPLIRLVNLAEKKLRSGLLGVGGAGI